MKLEGDEKNPETKYLMLCVLAIPDLSTSEERSNALWLWSTILHKGLIFSPYNIKS